jgi:glycosyl transferase family 25
MNIKPYVINLKKRPNRLDFFHKHYKLDIPYEVFEAVDGNDIDIYKLFNEGIIGNIGYQSVLNTNNNIPRTYHYELGSTGAIGCALSHINLYKKIVKENQPDTAYLIFEDDALVNTLKLEDINYLVETLPNDWHSYNIGQGRFVDFTRVFTSPIENPWLYKLNKFYGTHAYVINLKGAKWLLDSNKLFPINQQFDCHLSELIEYGFNVYVHSLNKYIYHYMNDSDIQSPIDINNNNYNRLKLDF